MKCLFGVFCLSAAALLAGCASRGSADDKPSPALTLREKQSAKAVVKGENLLKSYQSGNAKAFLAELSPALRSKVGEKDFAEAREAMLKNMGKVISWKFLTDLKAPVFRVHIWKVEVERDGSDGKRYQQEILFRTISGFPKDTEDPYLMSFGFL